MTAVPRSLPPPGNDSANAMESRQRAAQRLAARRRRRASRIRTGAIGGSLATFAAAWVVIFTQLVSGHDPALANNRQAVKSATTTATAPQSSGTGYSYDGGYSAPDPSPQQSSSSSSSDSGSGGASSSGTLNPVTTQQS